MLEALYMVMPQRGCAARSFKRLNHFILNFVLSVHRVFHSPMLLQTLLTSPKRQLIHYLVQQMFTENLTWATPCAKQGESDLNKSQHLASRKSYLLERQRSKITILYYLRSRLYYYIYSLPKTSILIS